MPDHCVLCGEEGDFEDGLRCRICAEEQDGPERAEGPHLVWYLEVTSWCGHGGVHFTGTLGGHPDGDFKRVRVEHVLTALTAARLTADRNDEYRYRRGQLVEQFWSEEEVRARAATLIDPTSALVRGSSAMNEPQEPIAGPPGWKEAATRIWAKAEAYGWNRWTQHEDEMVALCSRWYALLDEHGLTA